MDKRIVFISGANKGIGLEIARQLGVRNYEVIIGSRSEEKGAEALENLKTSGVKARSFVLDVTSRKQIQNLVSWIEQEYGVLDILVNNAGVKIGEEWSGNSVEFISEEYLRTTFEINFFGVINLTRALLPFIKKSDSGQIINVSSVMGSLSLHSQQDSAYYGAKPFAYNASKTALNQFTVHLAQALADYKIKVISAHPGWVKTELGSDDAPLSVEEGARSIVNVITREELQSGKYVFDNEELPW